MDKGRTFGRLSVALGALLAVVAPAVSLSVTAGAAPVVTPTAAPACPPAAPGTFECAALVRTDVAPSAVAPGTPPPGYSPSAIRTAYSLTTAPTGHPLVAIVDAFGDSHAYSDLTTYRSQFGLPAMAQCTGSLTASLCFEKVTQTGATTGYPVNKSGWDLEQALDIETVSAVCPKCSILLVEGNGATYGSLATAEDEAVTLGADVVSNSYTGSETTSVASHYSHAGVAIVAASGDSGHLAPISPASYPSVVSVGGTSLTSTNPRVETAWSDAGSGCSGLYAKPIWQQGVVSGCAKRAVADLSADADPNTGLATYDKGWYIVGGTSLSTPLVASAIAIAGNWGQFGTTGASYIYSHAAALNDVVLGANGTCASAMCRAGVGWDGPTGLGTPHALGAL